MNSMEDAREAYEPPTLTEIGGVHELTLTQAKLTTHNPDGFTFQGQVLTS